MIVNPLTVTKYFGGVYRFTRATIFPPGWGEGEEVGMLVEWDDGREVGQAKGMLA